MRRKEPIDWEHVEWLLTFNRTWDAVARDIGWDTRDLVDAWQKHSQRMRVKK